MANEHPSRHLPIAKLAPGTAACANLAPFRSHAELRAPNPKFYVPSAMNVIVILILISLCLALVFLACFVWAVKSGQYEDTFTPSMRILSDEKSDKKETCSNELKPHST